MGPGNGKPAKSARFRALRSVVILGFICLTTTATLANSVGTCRTQQGTIVAPWTDDTAPACGDDCDTERAVPKHETCESHTGFCLPNLQASSIARLLAASKPTQPAGPLCLYEGPECTPDLPPAASTWSWVFLNWIPSAETSIKVIIHLMPAVNPPGYSALYSQWRPPPVSPPPRVSRHS